MIVYPLPVNPLLGPEERIDDILDVIVDLEGRIAAQVQGRRQSTLGIMLPRPEPLSSLLVAFIAPTLHLRSLVNSPLRQYGECMALQFCKYRAISLTSCQ
ncbi:hypothetical protein FRC18_004994 [Serendipita sp. 400]|nr:hypothetical protein FRC18_004994 [Serendipita sp. 400]